MPISEIIKANELNILKIPYKKILSNSDEYLIHLDKRKPFAYALNNLEPEIVKSITHFQSLEQTEYIYEYNKGCIIEPSTGIAITRKNELIIESVPYYNPVNKPSYLRVLLYRVNSQNIYLKQAISIRYGWNNYFHFFNDVLGCMYLLDKHRIPNEIPIIIPESVMGLKYVQYFIKALPFLSDRKFILQNPHQLIKVDKVIFCKNIPSIREHFDYIVNNLSFPSSNSDLPDKIFLTRANTRERKLKNCEEVYRFITGIGFTVIDTAELSIERQILIFSKATHIIGIHGAGLSNMIFNKQEKLKILEIFPRNVIPPHYFWLSNEMKFDYNAMCQGDEMDGQFEINVKSLEAFIYNANFI